VSVKDVEDIANIQSSHRLKPKNPLTIIESSEDEEELAVPQTATISSKEFQMLELSLKKESLRELFFFFILIATEIIV